MMEDTYNYAPSDGMTYGGPCLAAGSDEFVQENPFAVPLESSYYAPNTLQMSGCISCTHGLSPDHCDNMNTTANWSTGTAQQLPWHGAKNDFASSGEWLVPQSSQNNLIPPTECAEQLHSSDQMQTISSAHSVFLGHICGMDLADRQYVAQLVDQIQPGIVQKSAQEWSFSINQLSDYCVNHILQLLAHHSEEDDSANWDEKLPNERVGLKRHSYDFDGQDEFFPCAKRVKSEESYSDENETEEESFSESASGSEYPASPQTDSSDTVPISTSAFVCNVCSKSFSSQAGLTKHLRLHNDEKMFPCPHQGCGKKFSHSSTLKDHMNIHLHRKPYTCKECGKGFPNGSNLNRHSRIHTKSKPYVCKVCNKCFSQSSNLRVHQKIHERAAKTE